MRIANYLVFSRDNASRLSIGIASPVTRHTGAFASRTGTSRLQHSRTATETQNIRSDGALFVTVIENNSKEIRVRMHNLRVDEVELRLLSHRKSYQVNEPLENQAYHFTRTLTLGTLNF